LNNKIAVLVCVLSLTLVGCGTTNTVFRDDSVASSELKKKRSYCGSIPRIYSGVAYDFCVLNGPPAAQAVAAVGFVPLIFFDFVASGVLDTVVLPYTVYRQGKDGSIDID
jgi:uncharacterized protein YceK